MANGKYDYQDYLTNLDEVIADYDYEGQGIAPGTYDEGSPFWEDIVGAYQAGNTAPMPSEADIGHGYYNVLAEGKDIGDIWGVQTPDMGGGGRRYKSGLDPRQAGYDEWLNPESGIDQRSLQDYGFLDQNKTFGGVTQELANQYQAQHGREAGERDIWHGLYGHLMEDYPLEGIYSPDRTRGSGGGGSSGMYDLTPENISFLQQNTPLDAGWGSGFQDIARNYSPNRAGFDEFLADMGQAGLPYTASGGSGSVQFGGGGPIIDIMRNYGTGGDAWQYLLPETTNGDPTNGDPTNGDPTNGDPTNGDPTNGLPSGGNTSDPGIPGQPGIGPLGETGFRSDSYPLSPPEWQDAFTLEVGNDPISQMQNLGFEGLLQGGGRIRTPLSAQTDRTLSDIMASGGELPLTGDEQQRQDYLDQVLSEGGISDATPLEDETQQILRDIIASGGQKPLDEQRRAMEIESARSPIDALRRAQLSQGQAAMAGRGTLGQGPEADYMQRVETKLAPMYADAAQQIALDEKDREDQRYNTAMAALSQQAQFQRASADQRYAMAQELRTSMTLDTARRQDDRLQQAIQESANLTAQQSANLVNTINAMTGMQQFRQDAAFGVLDRNVQWNQFLAEYGLKREEVLNALDSGRFGEILPLLNAFLTAFQTGATGFREQPAYRV